MERRSFIRNTAVLSSGILITGNLFGMKKPAKVYGHNGMTYAQEEGWGILDSSRFPVKDCHEMVQDKKGRIVLLTNEVKNNILVYNKSGKLKDSWGHAFPGAHGLTLTREGGEEFFFITDTQRHQVFKTTADGKVIMTIDYPADTGLYEKKEQFVPTETTVAPNGDIYIADGYGLQHIMQYDSAGKLKGHFGGKGETDANLDNAHGICVDYRKGDPTLLITDRTRCCFKRFSMDGKLLEIINLPGACVCRPVIKGDHLYAAVLRSPDLNHENSGFVTILDKDNKVVSNIGGSEPEYKDGILQPMRQETPLFKHPHDVCIDDDENIYVAQWASGKVYPYKFKRV